MKKLTKLAALLTAAVMMLTLFSSCKKNDTPNSDAPEYIYKPTYTKLADMTDGWTQYAVKGKDCVWISVYTANGEYEDSYQWTDENGVVQTETYVATKYVNKIYKVSLDGSTFTVLPDYAFDSYVYRERSGLIDGKYYEVYGNVAGLVPYEDTVADFVCENTTVYEVPADYNEADGNYWEYNSTYTSKYTLNILDENGNITEQKDLSAFADENSSIDYITSDADGNWYLGNWEGFTVVSPDFSAELFSVKENNYSFNNFIKLADGTVAVDGWAEDGHVVWPIDTENKKLGDKLPGSSNAYDFNSGVGDYMFISRSSSGLAGIKADGTSEIILNWLDCDLDSNSVRYPIPLDNGDFLGVCEIWDEEDSSRTLEIVKLTKTPYDPSEEREIINVAAIGINYRLRQRVLEYNKTNTEYRIRVTDYSQYSTDYDDTNALTKLNTEIIAGHIPDIFVVNSSMPITQYAGKGILEDLTPYMTRDFGEDAFVEDFFKTLRDDSGRLYEIYPGFYVKTVVGRGSVLGDIDSWTLEDVNTALAALQEGAVILGETYSREAAVENIIYGNMGSFVDWQTGECNFDSEEFIDLIELVKTFKPQSEVEQIYNSEDYDWSVSTYEKLMSGTQLLFEQEMYDFNDIRGQTFYAYNGDVRFVGYPGIGNLFGASDNGFALSAKSEHKDAAWEFMSYILTEEYQESTFSLPTNKAVFETVIKDAATPTFPDESKSESGEEAVDDNYGISYSVDADYIYYGTVEENEEAEYWYKTSSFNSGLYNENGVRELPKTFVWVSGGEYGDGTDLGVFSMTPAEETALRELIASVNVFARYDTSLSDIINEELAPFFSGQKSAADAAAMIQSRATIYVNEQR